MSTILTVKKKERSMYIKLNGGRLCLRRVFSIRYFSLKRYDTAGRQPTKIDCLLPMSVVAAAAGHSVKNNKRKQTKINPNIVCGK